MAQVVQTKAQELYMMYKLAQDVSAYLVFLSVQFEGVFSSCCTSSIVVVKTCLVQTPIVIHKPKYCNNLQHSTPRGLSVDTLLMRFLKGVSM